MISYAEDMTPLFDTGTVATYTCDQGFRFADGVGDEMRTCVVTDVGGSEQVSFNGTAPQCEREGEWLLLYRSTCIH